MTCEKSRKCDEHHNQLFGKFQNGDQSLRVKEDYRQFEIIFQDSDKMILKEYFKAILDRKFNSSVAKKNQRNILRIFLYT